MRTPRVSSSSIVVASLLFFACSSVAQAEVFDDFGDGNDAGWTHHDYSASATFGVTGGRYVLSVPVTGGEALVVSGRQGVGESFTDVVVTADLTGWTDGDDRYYGIGAGHPAGGDYFEGYALAYVNEAASTKLQLLRFDSLASWGPIASTPLALASGQHYRLVLHITGTTPRSLTGKIFAAANTTTPLATVSAVDASPPNATTGYSGVAMADLSLTSSGTISASFDDTFASAPTEDSDFDDLTSGDELLVHGTKPFSVDTDSDGLYDGEEVNTYLTDPLDEDTDDDGLTDWDELNAHLTDPLDSDSDNDGLSDGAEVNTYLTDPLDGDSDNDGMTDGFEVANGFAPTDPADGPQDADADALSNAAEEAEQTDPHDSDSDDDTLTDGSEVNTHGTNPLDANSDDDEFSDGVEVSLGTNPLVKTPFPFFGVPLALNTNAAVDTASDSFVELASDGAGNWVAAWQASGAFGLDLDILTARSTDAGATWTAPVALHSNAGSDSGNDANVQIAVDGSGNWVAVWQSSTNLGGAGTDFDIFVSRSSNAGATWTAPALLNTNATTDGSASDQSPQVATDGAGNWVAVWYSNTTLGGTIGSDNDILVARSSNAGATWTAPAALNSTAASDSSTTFDEYPKVAADAAGNWVAAWESNNTLGGTIGTDSDLLMARSSNAGATWTAAAPLNANAATDSGGDNRGELATDGNGTWVAVWQSTNPLGVSAGPDTEIAAARSINAGATWTTPVAVNSAAASDTGYDNYPKLATDGNGTWITVWHFTDSLFGGDEDILVARSSDAGASWSAKVSTSNAPSSLGADVNANVASDGTGRWVAAWNSNDTLGGTIGTDDDILFTTSGPDSDGDGLADGIEVLLGTDRLTADSDDDGLSDGAEFGVYATDPNDADTDDDGYSDGSEVLAGTDPLDPQDFPPPPVPSSGPWGLGVLAALLLVLGRRRLRPGLLAR